MKKRNMIIIAILLVIVLIIVLVTFGSGTQQQSGSAQEPNAVPAEAAPEETVPEPGTVYLNEEKEISATLDVAGGDGAPVEDEEPEDTTTTMPTPTPTEPADPEPEEHAKTEYEVFLALSPEQKDEFLKSFESYDAFFEWLVAAQEEFKNTYPDIEIGPGGSIDLSKLK